MPKKINDDFLNDTIDETLEVRKEINKQGWLISKLDHPVVINYAGQGLRLSPKAKVLIENKDLLGALPGGVIIK
jgi:hypothetical protein